MRALLLLLLCAVAFGADQQPVVRSTTTGLNQNLQAGDRLKIPTASGGFYATIDPGVQTATRVFSLPVTLGTDTIAVLGLPQTYTATQTFPAPTTGGASIVLPHGTAPTSPANGATWTTTAGLFTRINGVTVGPLAAGTVTGVTAGDGSVTMGGTAGVAPTVSLSTTGVAAGSYTSANLTVDNQGRITVASNGSGGSGLPTGLTAVSPIFGPDTVLTTNTLTTAASPEGRAFYPSSVFFLPLTQRANLQSALDQYGAVRLETGDYSAGTVFNSTITMRSGYRLYGTGFITCKVPSLVIAAGAQGVVVSGVGSFASPQTIALTAGSTIGNAIFRHVGYVTYTGTSCDVDGCTWIDCVNSQWLIDCTAGGHWSNNRMIGMSSQGTAPELSILGNPSVPSVGNQYGIHISLQQNAATYGMKFTNHQDASVWLMNSERNNGTAQPGLVADSTNTALRLFSLAGGQNAGTMLSIGTPKFLLDYNNLSGNSIATAFGATNTSSVSFYDIRQSLNTDAASSPTRFSGFDNSGSLTKLNGTTITAAVAGGPAATFAALMYPARTEALWNSPTWDLPPTAGLGPAWASQLASLPDSSAYLQGLINAGVAMPGPGVFKIVTPLKIGDGHGLIGAGMNRTILVAATTGTDIIQNDTAIVGDNQHIVLTDCTLQGGLNGIHHSGGGTLRFQFTNMIISHVCFRDMVNAGMFCDQIYAWDSNSISNCDFVNCAYGLRSLGPAGAGADYIGYVDKMHIFHSRFLSCGYGTYWNELNRADNNDVCVSCAFNDCVTGASFGDQMNEQAFVNCVFNNNAGDPTVKVTSGELQMLGCTMNASGQSFGSMVDGSSIYMSDCVLNLGTGTGFNGFGNTFPTSQKFLHNNTFNIPCPVGLTNIQSVNNSFTQDNAPLRVGYAFKTSGTLVTAISTTSSPVPQYLRGAALPALLERFETVDGQGSATPFSPKLLAASGGLSGTLTATRVPFASGSSTLVDAPALTYSTTTGLSNNLANTFRSESFGAGAGNTTLTGTSVTVLGASSGSSLTSASSVTIVGSQSGSALSTGGKNTQLGDATGQTLSTGTANILLGTLADTDTAGRSHAFVAGSNAATGTGITDVWFGTGIAAATPGVYVIHGSGALGTNVGGAALQLAGGQGTGTGVGGSVQMMVAPVGASGATQNALAEVARFTLAKDLLIGTTTEPTNTGGVLSVAGETYTSASTTARAGLNVAPGVAPTAPTDGDVWTTTAGIFTRVNGVTVGPLAAAGAASAPEARTVINLSTHMVEDFSLSPLGDKSSGGNVNSTGALNDPPHLGVWKLQTNAGTTNIACIGTNAVGLTFGQGSGYLDWVFQTPVLSNGTDRYTVRIGFGSQNASDPNDGAYLRYSDSVNAGKWQLVTRSAGTETATDTGVTGDLLWHRVRITFNAGGTSVSVAFDGGATAATNTTNIPAGQFRTFGIFAEITKSLGTTSLALLLDMMDFSMTANL